MSFGQAAPQLQQSSAELGAKYHLVVCGHPSDIPASISRICLNFGWSYAETSSSDDAIQALSSTPTSVFVAIDDGGHFREIAKLAKQQSPATTRLMLSPNISQDFLSFAVNEIGVLRVLALDASDDEVVQALQDSINDYILRMQESGLLKQVSRQNRKLEELRTNLEAIVSERTHSIEKSKDQAEARQKSIRDLVRFIKDLARVGSVTDIVYLLRRELKKLNGVLNPTLGYLSQDGKPYLVSFRGSQLFQKQAAHPWQALEAPRLNEKDDRQFLANQLGRPIAKLIAVPLKAQTLTESHPIMFIEHNLSDVEASACVESMSERFRSLAVAIDRVLVGHQLSVAALYWESTFDAIASPVSIITVDYRVLRANRYFADSAFETQCHKQFAGSQEPCIGCPIQEALTTGRPVRGQVKIRSRLFEVNSYPIKFHGTNRATTVVNQYRDITEDRKLYGQMLQNEKMVALGLLAGNLAHELNNPLTGLKSMSQVLQHDERVPDRLKADLKEIEDAAGRSQQIVKNLLEFSQLPDEAQTRVVDLNSIINRTMPLLKTAMRIHNREIYLADEEILIDVDPNLLSQVVFNLVNNACQAMPGAGTITISTERREQWAHIIIADTGTGIAPDLIEKIFEPFFTTKAEGEGTGIGLSMSLSIVERFGGAMTVQSQLGVGTQFDVRLPVVRRSDENSHH